MNPHRTRTSLDRRPLNESQRAMVAAKIANLEKGQRPNQDGRIRLSAEIVQITQKAAASITNLPGNQRVPPNAPIGAGNIVPVNATM